MNFDVWKFPLISTLVCLLPYFVLGVFVAIQARNFWTGVKLFLLIALPLTTLVALLVYYDDYLSDEAQKQIGIPIVSFSLVVIAAIGILFKINKYKVGSLMPNGRRSLDSWTLLIGTAVTVLLLLQGIISIVGGNRDWNVIFDFGKSIILWPIASLAILRAYLSFEFRQRGVVSKGKVIFFSDIERAEWDDLFDKTRLKLQLKSNDKKIIIKTPWEMLMPIDDYIRSNFPRSQFRHS
ncbi:MAG: hypothetical protein HY867_05900 [Chloroflexi bacterium]|nr:hypothetical protein [Chloroflexota bacterium]